MNKIVEINTGQGLMYGVRPGEKLLAIRHTCPDTGLSFDEKINSGAKYREYKQYQSLASGAIMRQELIWGAEDGKKEG